MTNNIDNLTKDTPNKVDSLLGKYNFISRNPETQEIEIFLDHHSMATFRQCQAKFELEILNNIRPKGQPSWPLAFGGCLFVLF